MKCETNRYYIAVPTIQVYGYQTTSSWTNFSFTGKYEDAIKTTIELFKENELLKDEAVLDKMRRVYMERHVKVCDMWETLDENVKNIFRNKIYRLLIEYESDETNSGLILWDNVPNKHKMNIWSDDLNVIELQ